MKRIFLLMAGFLLMVFSLSAQTVDLIQEKGKLDAVSYSIDIEYIADLREAKITYSCNSGMFDEKNAITIIKNRLILFTKEKGYFSFAFYDKDILKYDNEKKLAKYTSFVKFYY